MAFPSPCHWHVLIRWYQCAEKRESSGKRVTLPAVFKAPIRPDIVNCVHTNLQRNSRQPYAVSELAGHETHAESWGAGRAVAWIPRPPGGRTHHSECFWKHVSWSPRVHTDLETLAPLSESNTAVICHPLCTGGLGLTSASHVWRKFLSALCWPKIKLKAPRRRRKLLCF